MRPILFEIGGIPIPAWHSFYVLGALAAFVLMGYLRRKHLPAIPAFEIGRLYTLCYIAGYLGARLLSIWIEEPETRGLEQTLSSLTQLGAMTFYGGALAAFGCGALYVKLRRLPLADLLDLAMPAGLLALGLGRIGCFLNGDDYGKAVPLARGGEAPFWAVTFPNLEDSIARYPVQLIEAGFAFVCVALLLLSWRKLRAAFRPGVVGLFAIVAYANFRFLIEFWRDDFRGFAFGTWLSTSQFISVIVLALCGASIPFWIRTQKPSPSTTLEA